MKDIDGLKDKKPYLKELKDKDPEKLRIIREKALDIRRADTAKIKTIQELMKGNLSLCVVMRDKKTNQIMKDNNGRPIEITKKELLVMNVVDNAITDGKVKDLVDIGEIIGDIEKKQENQVNIVFDNIRKELEEID